MFDLMFSNERKSADKGDNAHEYTERRVVVQPSHHVYKHEYKADYCQPRRERLDYLERLSNRFTQGVHLTPFC